MSGECPHCGNRTTSPEHEAPCAELHAARRAAREVAESPAYAIPAVAVDDLWAHLVSPRPGGAWCTPQAAAYVIRCAAELGWRPRVGRWAS